MDNEKTLDGSDSRALRCGKTDGEWMRGSDWREIDERGNGRGKDYIMEGKRRKGIQANIQM